MPGVEFVGFNRRSRSRLFLFCILCMILLLLHSYKYSWHITSYIVFLAVLLRDIAGYDENPFIRANCFLAETGKPTVMLNKRYGEKEELEPLTAGMAEKLLEEAYAQAHEKAGITWEGQEFLVEGNPAVLANASAEDDEKGN